MMKNALGAVGGAALMAALVPAIVVVGLSGARLQAQAPATDAARPAFEVASVKAHKEGDNRTMFQFQPGGRFRAINVPRPWSDERSRRDGVVRVTASSGQ